MVGAAYAAGATAAGAATTTAGRVLADALERSPAIVAGSPPPLLLLLPMPPPSEDGLLLELSTSWFPEPTALFREDEARDPPPPPPLPLPPPPAPPPLPAPPLRPDISAAKRHCSKFGEPRMLPPPYMSSTSNREGRRGALFVPRSLILPRPAPLRTERLLLRPRAGE